MFFGLCFSLLAIPLRVHFPCCADETHTHTHTQHKEHFSNLPVPNKRDNGRLLAATFFCRLCALPVYSTAPYSGADVCARLFFYFRRKDVYVLRFMWLSSHASSSFFIFFLHFMAIGFRLLFSSTAYSQSKSNAYMALIHNHPLSLFHALCRFSLDFSLK